MKISYNWLKDYINLKTDPEKTAEILTDIGLEVEGTEHFESVAGGLKGVVIGEVKSAEPHPNADKLILTRVDIGQPELLNIICGAPNVRTGQKVPVAVAGTILFKGEESFTLKKTRIRGELSEGMICAEDELGLGTSHEGIMVLDEKAPIGTPARDYFDVFEDQIFEIGLTPNRIDGASHYGVARDLSAFLRQREKCELNRPSVENFRTDNNDYPIGVSIENESACPRYTGVTITGLTVEESPGWLQNRLKSVGLSPVNNIVDITNFVLLETGQPLHAFDADKIAGGKIIVRTLKEGATFTTLDEEERELSGEDLMICDVNGGMCIAGVFGGIDSGVTENTKNIFLESAYFDPVYIRKTAKRHNLNTDASFRFERGADPEMTIYALKRAAMLITETIGGKISSNIVDIYPEPLVPCKVSFSYRNVDRLIGEILDRESIKSILSSLEIKTIAESKEGLELEIPLYRVDVKREADVIEEVLRIYGYNRIDIHDGIKSTLSHVQKPDKEKITNMISDMLSDNGFNEIMTNSLTPSAYYGKVKPYPKEQTVRICNPLSSDLNAMRQTMLYGGLEAILYNINRKNRDLKFYEFGNCYFYRERKETEIALDHFSEQEHLALFITGLRNKKSWSLDASPNSFFYLKSFVENILVRLGFKPGRLEQDTSSQEIFSEALRYNSVGRPIVDFGMVNQSLLTGFDIKQNVFYADFIWTTILDLIGKHEIHIEELPKFPEVKRDLALLIDKSIPFSQVKSIAYRTEKILLKSITLFDVFEDEKIGKNKKSYAASFILQDKRKTLTDKQIDQVMKRLMNAFEREIGAKIR